jgi:hypothetical protein
MLFAAAAKLRRSESERNVHFAEHTVFSHSSQTDLRKLPAARQIISHLIQQPLTSSRDVSQSP